MKGGTILPSTIAEVPEMIPVIQYQNGWIQWGKVSVIIESGLVNVKPQRRLLT